MNDRTPDEILAYCEKATAGPWHDDGFKVNHNAQFIANARTDLPRMAKRVEELTKECRDRAACENSLVEWNEKLAQENAKLKALCREAVSICPQVCGVCREATSIPLFCEACKLYESLHNRLREAGGDDGQG